MKQIQQTALSQRFSLTPTMRNSLDLLHMEQRDIVEEVEAERTRNPFLKIGNPERFVPGVVSVGTRPPTDHVAAPKTRSGMLLDQIGLMRLSSDERQLALELVHCLDERGLMSDSPKEIAKDLGVLGPRVRELVAKLQALDPPGVFAWSLSDSFRLQLQAKNRLDPLITVLLERLDLVANRDIDAICRLCGVDQEDAQDMIADIRSLSPSPFHRFEPELAAIQRPDLIMMPDEHGSHEAKLNPDALPNLLTDDALFSERMAAETDDNAAAYYRDCYRGAGSLVAALQKRANTLLSIGKHIALVQDRFLRTGRNLDRAPLTTSQAAGALGLNKSTISRALNGCTIETKHGVLNAADFFVRPLNASTNTKTRDQALKRLALLIKTENSSSPLSDESLSQLLAKANFRVSRRTVAKYRGLLGIPHSSRR